VAGRRSARAAAWLIGGAVLLAGAGACDLGVDGTSAGRVGSAASGTALAALDAIPVRGRAPQTGYTREKFGDGWVDTDHNGCDTRNDVLARDLTGERFEPGTHDCIVVSGTLADPYSGKTIRFRRGQDTSEAVQIDHVVALSDAWQKGAQQWSADKRTAFANDPLNLLAVDGPLNQGKGDGDAATWLPPNRAYRCSYVARQVAVKAGYGLWMTRAEHDAVAAVLQTCPGQRLPDGRSAAAAPAAVPPSAASSSASSASASSPAAAPSYASCSDVRAAGAAPIHRGDPGWSDSFDSDGDGVGCE
jgi:hypothetical protein